MSRGYDVVVAQDGQLPLAEPSSDPSLPDVELVRHCLSLLVDVAKTTAEHCTVGVGNGRRNKHRPLELGTLGSTTLGTGGGAGTGGHLRRSRESPSTRAIFKAS